MSPKLWIRLGSCVTLAAALCLTTACSKSYPTSRSLETSSERSDAPERSRVERRRVLAPERPSPRRVGEYSAVGTTPQGDGSIGLQGLQVVNDESVPDMYFTHFGVNPTIDTEEEPTSTFSIDVDTASYSLTRAYLSRAELVPEAAVRVEEFVNAFDYAYTPPDSEVFSLHAEAFSSPTRPGYHVLQLGIQGRRVEARDRKPANLVFVIDVSGSMGIENRLGSVKQALRLLVDQLRASDSVGIVVYGNRADVILEPLGASERTTILRAIDSIEPSGSTNAQAGIELGYRMAARNRIPGGINRVILCSDGVANNGISTSADGIFDTVRREAERGVTISTVGFGMGNYNDVLMERLAQIGDGNYAYVDRRAEAERIFVQNLTQTLQVIAKDAKIQVEFDPRSVARFRLLGYENRRLEREDFENDRVDAGEVGAGHAVTALYEIKFREGVGDIGWLRIRYKSPDGGSSRLMEKRIPASVVHRGDEPSSPPSQLAFVAASFAEKLRGSYWVRNVSYEDLSTRYAELPARLRSRDDVKQLGELIEIAKRLDQRPSRFPAEDEPGRVPDFDRVPILE